MFLLITSQAMVAQVANFVLNTQLFESGKIERAPSQIDLGDSFAIFSFFLCCIVLPGCVFGNGAILRKHAR